MAEAKKGLRNIGISLVILNLFLALLKTIVWLHTDSLAVFSEAANSWIDTVYSLLILVGIFISTKDPTEQYPEGYRRIEPFIAIVTGIGVVITALVVARGAAETILTGNSEVVSESSAITVLVFSGLMKYVMYRYCIKIYQQTKSPIIMAVGIDNRNDILTIIIALTGLLATTIGFQIDAYAAILVSVAILYSGITILKKNSEYVLARTVPEEQKESIRKVALENENVKGLHDVRIHYSGPQIDVSMHLEVPGGLTIEEGHEIEKKVSDRIQKVCEDEINEINLHTDPKSLEEWEDS